MKKHFIAVLLALVMCLAVFSGCSFAKIFERDVQVILHVDGEYAGCYTVNIFNNAVVPEPDPPQGKQLRGWTADPDWEEYAETVSVTANTGLIRYDDIKDWIDGDSLSVTLYAVFAEIPRHDIAIAWYSKFSMSGIDDNHMADFETKLRTYLTSEGYTPAEMDIVIRAYDGDVGTSCAQIKKDGDIDIMVGWAANIATTGGMTKGEDFIENVGNLTIGSTARYAARLSDTELCNLIYLWIQSEYGPEMHTVTFNSNGGSDVATKLVELGKTVSQPANPIKEGYIFEGWYTDDVTFENEYDFTKPVTDDLVLYAKWTEGAPVIEHTIVIGWWDYSTSKLTAGIMKNVTEGLKTYLASQDYNIDTVEIILQAYDGNKVANVVDAVIADGNVNIMLGMGGNFTTTAGADSGNKITSVDYDSAIPMGAATNTRYMHLLTEGEFERLVFEWLKTDDGKALLLATE